MKTFFEKIIRLLQRLRLIKTPQQTLPPNVYYVDFRNRKITKTPETTDEDESSLEPLELTMRFPPEAHERICYLQKLSGAKTNIEVITCALALYDTLLGVTQKDGGRVYVRIGNDTEIIEIP